MKQNKKHTAPLSQAPDGFVVDGKFVPSKQKSGTVYDVKIIIAAKDSDGRIHPNTTPREFPSTDAAITAAKSMASRHGGTFVVLNEIAVVSMPEKIEPTVRVHLPL